MTPTAHWLSTAHVSLRFILKSIAAIAALTALTIFAASNTYAAESSQRQQTKNQSSPAPYPKYKPSSRSPAPVDIRSNAYGASRSAPDALAIGDTIPDFVLPKAGGSAVSLLTQLAQGPVALIFYRGHW